MSRWNRLLWGVLFSGLRGEEQILIGGTWAMDLGGNPYPGEPTRALLFQTRKQARAWCAEKRREWSTLQRDDCVARWRVRPVRVRETVKVEAPNRGERATENGVEARWYCLSRDGLATLCASEQNAREMAADCTRDCHIYDILKHLYCF